MSSGNCSLFKLSPCLKIIYAQSTYRSAGADNFNWIADLHSKEQRGYKLIGKLLADMRENGNIQVQHKLVEFVL
jgi:hypothetical protein